MLRLLQLFALVTLLVAAVAAFVGYRAYETALADYKGYDADEIFYTVERGTNGSRIASELEENRIIEDRRIFVAALRLRGVTNKIQAGEYRFAEPISTMDVIDRLVAGDIYTFGVTVPEGLTVRETAEHLAANGVGEADALEAAFQDTSLIASIDEDATDLEGYLFPTRYEFPRDPSPSDVARTLTAQFLDVFDDAKRAKAEERGLSARQVVTLASVIEKETGNAAERPVIGSVVWNRLDIGMPLAMDSTVIFALKLQGRYDGNIRRVDLEMDHPYNTYRVAGPPPGPIASPGEASIDAVLEPAATEFLYFVSKNDGSHHFSKTYREHARAVRKYQVEYFRRRRGVKSGEGSS